MAKNAHRKGLTTILIGCICSASWTTLSRGEVKARSTARPSHRTRQARTDLYNPVSGSLSIGFRNASGSRDYLNPRTGRLYLGFKNKNGSQDLLNPRRGTWRYGFRNPDGSSDYLDPRTGRWVLGVNTSRRPTSARGSYQKRTPSTKAAPPVGPRKIGFRHKRPAKSIGGSHNVNTRSSQRDQRLEKSPQARRWTSTLAAIRLRSVIGRAAAPKPGKPRT